MGKASRDKGKRGELEARDMVREYWNSPKCVRSAQVSGQFAGDLMYGPHGLHLEVKRYKRIVSSDFMVQAQEDQQPGEVPVVLSRQDGRGWDVTFPMNQTRAFLRLLVYQMYGIDLAHAPTPSDA